MLYAELDLSRKRLDVHVLDEEGRTVLAVAQDMGGEGAQRVGVRMDGHYLDDSLTHGRRLRAARATSHVTRGRAIYLDGIDIGIHWAKRAAAPRSSAYH
jgi:hypothetical protein